jgi:hypothetical protein
MIKNILKAGAYGLLSLSILALPIAASAQSTNKPAVEKKSAKKDSAKGHAFHGKLVSVDKTEKSISVGKSTYFVTSDTKITKDGKPAVLEDGVVGEECGGYVKTNTTGKAVLTSLRFGAAPDKKSTKSEKTDAAPAAPAPGSTK